MSEQTNKGAIQRFLEASPDSTGKTLFVAVALCLFASMVVSAAAVALRPTQEANKLKDKQINILQVAVFMSPASISPRLLAPRLNQRCWSWPLAASLMNSMSPPLMIALRRMIRQPRLH